MGWWSSDRAADIFRVVVPGAMAGAMIARGIYDQDNGVAGVGIGFAGVAAFFLQRAVTRCRSDD